MSEMPAIQCDACDEALTEFGGLAFSPPDDSNDIGRLVLKYHLCAACWGWVERFITRGRSQDRPLHVEVYEQRLVQNHDDRDDEPFTEYRWRVRHVSNGENMASGEGYADKRDRDHALSLLHPDLEPVEVDG